MIMEKSEEKVFLWMCIIQTLLEKNNEYCSVSANEAHALLSARLVSILDWAKALVIKQ